MKIKSKKISALLMCSMIIFSGVGASYANKQDIDTKHTIGGINLNVGRTFIGKTGPVPKSEVNNGSGTIRTNNIVATSGSQISNPQIWYQMVNSNNADRSEREYIGDNELDTFKNSGSKDYVYYLKIWSKTYISSDRRLNVKGTWSPDTGQPH